MKSQDAPFRIITFSAVTAVLFLFLSATANVAQRSAEPDKRRITPQSYPSDLGSGTVDPSFAATVTEGSGAINKMVVQPDGKIIAVGNFKRFNGVSRIGIARFNPDGSIDSSFDPGTGATGTLNSVKLQPDGKILIGGNTGFFNGSNFRGVMRLNSDGSVDSTFSPSSSFNSVLDIAVQADGKVLVGGSFSVSSSRFVRLNSDGSIDFSFGFNSVVRAILITIDNKILVGGDRDSASRAIRKLNLDGTDVGGFSIGTGPNNPVWELAAQADGKFVVGGPFTSYNGTSSDGIARITSNGSLDQAYEFTSESASYFEVSALSVLSDGKVLATFYLEGVTFRTTLIRLNTDGTLDGAFTSRSLEAYLGADIQQLGDGSFVVGGGFVNIDGNPRLRVAKFASNGATDTAFSGAASTDGIVFAVKVQSNGKILIGGDFDYVNGVRKSGIARLNPDGSLDSSFNTVGNGFVGRVYSIAIQDDGKILTGGFLFYYNNANCPYIGRLNEDGSFDRSMWPGTANNFLLTTVYGIDIQTDGKIVVAGSIVSIGNFARYSALRINSDGSFDTTFNPQAIGSGQTFSVAVQPASGKILIGGSFTPSATLNRAGSIRLNPDGTLDTAPFSGNGNVWAISQSTDGSIFSGGQTIKKFSENITPDPIFTVGTGTDNVVRAMAIQNDGKLIAGGQFATLNGVPVSRLIRLNLNGTVDSAFEATPNSSVLALALQPDQKLLVGGAFTAIGAVPRLGLARISTRANTTAAFDFDGDGSTDISIFRPQNGQWWLRRSTAGTIAHTFGGSTDVRVPADYTGDGVTDVAIFRPETAEWFVLRSENYSFYSFPFGLADDVVVPGDYDGDGISDPTVFRAGTWYINQSSSGMRIETFGAPGDRAVPSDYDGDGSTDIAIFRPSNGQWWLHRSTDGIIAITFGTAADKLVPGDYTGDGKSDLCLWRDSTGEWFVLRSENFSYFSVPFGLAGDKPVPGDYDGDGKFDYAVFRPNNATWFVSRSSSGLLIEQFGTQSDIPVPSAYVR